MENRKAKAPVTHERFIAMIAALAASKLTNEEKAILAPVKLVYGAGPNGVRGVTYYGKWKANGNAAMAAPFVEISAFGQESWIQVAGTCLHELGHVLAGYNAAHGKGWKEACAKLGLRKAKAAGMRYSLACFAPDIREAIANLPRPNEGEPVRSLSAMGLVVTPRPCGAGIGTKGGKSRGPGSGSRLRLYTCQCEPIVRVRAAGTTLQAHCDLCSTPFVCQS